MCKISISCTGKLCPTSTKKFSYLNIPGGAFLHSHAFSSSSVMLGAKIEFSLSHDGQDWKGTPGKRFIRLFGIARLALHAIIQSFSLLWSRRTKAKSVIMYKYLHKWQFKFTTSQWINYCILYCFQVCISINIWHNTTTHNPDVSYHYTHFFPIKICIPSCPFLDCESTMYNGSRIWCSWEYNGHRFHSMLQITTLAGHVSKCLALWWRIKVTGQPLPAFMQATFSLAHRSLCSVNLHAWKRKPQLNSHDTISQLSLWLGCTVHFVTFMQVSQCAWTATPWTSTSLFCSFLQFSTKSLIVVINVSSFSLSLLV